MATVSNYTSSTTNYMWTGLNYLNQIWSAIKITEPIILTQIQIHWGGYDSTAYGAHFIAKIGVNQSDLNGSIVQSSTISVPQGRAWRTASVTPTFLEPGTYAVGVYGNPSYRRTCSRWSPVSGVSSIWTSTETSGYDPYSNGTVWDDGTPIQNVLPAILTYEPAGRMWVNANGTWKHGQSWVNVNGVWKKAKGVWVNSNGTWKRGQ